MARLTLGLALVACSAANPRPADPPPDLPLEDEVVNAARVAAEQPELVVRYNPVRCSCPPFEIQLGARWVRLHIEGLQEPDGPAPDSPAGKLLATASADLQAGAVRHYRVAGDLGQSPSKCGQGALFLSLSLAEEEAE
ncbi:MAG: hypothetical protein ACI9WU_001869 [Myxococcota bacterium]|jgi:hypothetical protein